VLKEDEDLNSRRRVPDERRSGDESPKIPQWFSVAMLALPLGMFHFAALKGCWGGNRPVARAARKP